MSQKSVRELIGDANFEKVRASMKPLFPDGNVTSPQPMTNWTPRWPNTLAGPMNIVDSSLNAGTLGITWSSIPGRTYTILYSDDVMLTWLTATPSLTANATQTQWYDDGPPKTESKPLSIASRVYRVVVAPIP